MANINNQVKCSKCGFGLDDEDMDALDQLTYEEEDGTKTILCSHCAAARERGEN